VRRDPLVWFKLCFNPAETMLKARTGDDTALWSAFDEVAQSGTL
jgi:hypothetical protein